MGNFTPAANVGWAAVITTITVALLKILIANGIKIPEDVMNTLPPAVPVLVAYLHDLATGANKKPSA